MVRRLQLVALVLLLAGCVSGRPTSTAPACIDEQAAIKPAVLVFRTVPELSPFGDGHYWYLTADLIWESKDESVVEVPAGFVTDFASVPTTAMVGIAEMGEVRPSRNRA